MDITIPYHIVCAVVLFLMLRKRFKDEGEISLRTFIIYAVCIFTPVLNIAALTYQIIENDLLDDVTIWKRKNKESR